MRYRSRLSTADRCLYNPFARVFPEVVRVLRWAAAAFVAAAIVQSPAGAAPPIPVSPLFSVGGDAPSSPFRNAQGLFYDRLFDEVYVADTGNHRIVVLDRDGYPLHSLVHYVTLDGERIPGEPKSVAVDNRGHIFVVDALSRDVDVLDPQGIQIGMISPGELLPGDPPERAETITADGTGHIYIGVSGHYTGVLVLNERWDLVGTCPSTDSDDQPDHIAGVWVDAAGDIYIADPSGVPALRVFREDGGVRLAFGKHDVGYDNFSRPSGVTVGAEGTLWVVDMIRQVVKAFDGTGRFLALLGGRGENPGALDYPSAATTDGRQRLYVLNRRVGGLVCFDVDSEGILALAETLRESE